MKNTFKETRKAESAKKEAERKAAARQARLDAIEPVDIVGTMEEVINNTVRVQCDQEDRPIGVNGGTLHQTIIKKDNKQICVAAATEADLDTKCEQIKNGLFGDGMYHKQLTIGGYRVDCAGATLEELEKDIAAAEDYLKKHSNGHSIKDLIVAEQLVDCGYSPEDLEEVKGKRGKYLIVYSERAILSLRGETVVSLEDISSPLFKQDIKTILLERLERKEKNR